MFTEKKVKCFPQKVKITLIYRFRQGQRGGVKKRLLPVRNLPAREGEMNRILGTV
jgi:hypothetical protein